MVPSVYGLNTVIAAPSTGLLGTTTMSAGVLLNSIQVPASSSLVWGNNNGSTGWGIRLDTDSTAPATQLWNVLINATTTPAGRTGSTSPEILGFNAWTFIAFTISGTALRIYINGQLAASTTLGDALTPGAAVPVLTGDSSQWLAGAFYTDTVLTAGAIASLATGIMSTGDLGSASILGQDMIENLGIQHVYSAARSSQRGAAASTAWEDVGTLANRPLTVSQGPALRAVLPGLFI